MARRLLASEGPASFFRGILPTLAREVPGAPTIIVFYAGKCISEMALILLRLRSVFRRQPRFQGLALLGAREEDGREAKVRFDKEKYCFPIKL